MGRAGARGRGKSRPSREPAIGIKKTNFCSRIAPVNWIYALIAFRRDGAMLLVLTLFWRWAVPGLRGCLNIFPFFSRFGVFNSRPTKFLFSPATAIGSQRLDLARGFRSVEKPIDDFPGYFPVERETQPLGGWRRSCSGWCRLALS
jgi:hypothetical protein